MEAGPKRPTLERNITEHTRNRNRPAMPDSLYEVPGIALRCQTGTRGQRLRIFLLSPANASGMPGHPWERSIGSLAACIFGESSTMRKDLRIPLRESPACRLSLALD